MAYELQLLSDTLGAEISGLRPDQGLSAQDERNLRDAFLQHHMLCVRSEPLTAAQFVSVARVFGDPKVHVLRRMRHEDFPEVTIHNSTWKTPADKPANLKLDRRSAWHTDDSYFEEPAKATLLQSLEIPSSGGQTCFVNTRKAYEDLSDSDKSRIDRKKAVHDYDTDRAPATASGRTTKEVEETPEVVHPLVRVHEDTGARAIFYNPNRTDRVVGVDRQESDVLLDWVDETVTNTRHRYDHEWQVGDILVWDNRCTLHSVNMDFPVGERRVHQRILIRGPRPV